MTSYRYSTHRASNRLSVMIAIIIAVSSGLFFFNRPQFVQAQIDNTDSNVAECSVINISGLPVSPDVIHYPSRSDADNLYYSIRVCGGGIAQPNEKLGWPSALQCLEGSGKLVASINYKLSSFQPWISFELTPDGADCFKGEIRKPKDQTWNGFATDIEINDSAACNRTSVGTPWMPVCRRFTPRISQVEDPDTASRCTAALAAVQSCSFISISPERVDINQPVTFTGTAPDFSGCPLIYRPAELQVEHANDPGNFILSTAIDASINETATPTTFGRHNLIVDFIGPSSAVISCRKTFNVCLPGVADCTITPPPPPDGGSDPTVFELCSQVAGDVADKKTPKGQCDDCLRLKRGVWTAVGCIPAEPSSMIKSVITIGVGIGGGVALLMTLIGGFLLTTSQGNPKQQETAKEMITSAVIGLLFVMFSVVILQFVGVTILQIPGFGTLTEAPPK